MKKNFNEIYNNVCKESNSSLESLRKKQVKRFIILFLIIIAAIVIIKMPNLTYSTVIGYILGIFIMVDLLAICFGSSKYNKLFKETIIKTFIKEYNENFLYMPNGKISSKHYIDAEFERFDYFDSEDYIKGTIDENIKLEIAEVNTQEEHVDKDGESTTVTIFHGLFAAIELPKFFSGKTKIRNNAVIQLFNGTQKLEMDSSEFEKCFDVTSTNKVEAMQILTADIMEKLIEFRNKNSTEITLKGNKIYIRFRCGEMFEAKLFKKALDYGTLLKYYEMINLVCDVSKELVKTVKESNI